MAERGGAERGGAEPAFGRADLSNCEREQIHLAGSIQPHGALLLVQEPDGIIVQASANAAEFLNQSGSLIGRRVVELDANLAERIAPLLESRLHDIPVPVRCALGTPRAAFDGLLHRPSDAGLAIELVRAGPPVDLTPQIAGALKAIVACPTLKALADEAAVIFKQLVGYDRVMVYRFDEAGHGEVLSEERRHDLESYLGNRYPASDIPQIARKLYERNRVRMLVDVGYEAVPLTPRLSPLTGRDLDMSLCFLRSMSPIHLEYLGNMGVDATLVVSLMVRGKLWGLVACHHYERRFVQFETRAACELLAEAVATRIAALDSFVRAQAELAARRLEQRMVEAIGRDGDWRLALFDGSPALLQPVGATGAALLFDGQVLTAGEVPGTPQLREIGRWLDRKPRSPVFATNSLPLEEAAFACLKDIASGLLAVPVSVAPGEYLIWFRPEQVRTVTWGGDPDKPFIIGNDPSDLSPRRSFAQWHQVVEGTSEPWSPAELAAARLVGESVTDVILQFRSVRMLIAQDQLESVSRDVRVSAHPVIISDVRGRILLVNEAFELLLRSGHPHLEWLDDLPHFFEEPAILRDKLRNLLARRQGWRGDLRIDGVQGPIPLHLRADPILASPDRILGFVLLFTDVSERKAADVARRRFQQGILEQPRPSSVRLDSGADLLYRNLLAAIVENAQLAALEITDGVHPSRIPESLETVRASVARAAEVLKHLIHHASQGGDVTPARPQYGALRDQASQERRPRPGNGSHAPGPLRRH